VPPSITTIGDDAFAACPKLKSIDILVSLSLLIVSKGLDNEIEINPSLGSLYEVIKNKGFLTPISFKLFQLLGLAPVNKEYNDKEHEEENFCINWGIQAKIKNEHNGRWPLYIALEQNLKWSDGSCEILEANGSVIEDSDRVIG